ncbi:Uncharacterised protein [Yersinia frederiksenii]|uniref:Uncharacterized protein n=1 Tax=Yersinia alsatica TaxID=2890317 RepID=A0ABY5UJA1_9GAMM|nr:MULTISPECIES: hypothetical protein [Yersinia]OWF69088.1 hypothetical protein B4901_08675 [Yersinia frederiksenii]UWM43542.1 hypothetical protein N0H69_12460 [Yersinia alsatica]CNB66026.1 Uncharacterised protein [Yersinia frederiksenii]CNK67514.1 Uncharacterised protein [Yersinia frederiksenii]CNL54957.1 Uncharacterised protein [Yersinia frederiksenii]
MKFKEIKLSIKPLHDAVAQLSTDNEIIGYAVKNTNSKLPAASIVLPNGETLGDYHCMGCAIKAAAKNYIGIGEDEAIEANFSLGKKQVRDLLLIALLSKFVNDLAPQEKH